MGVYEPAGSDEISVHRDCCIRLLLWVLPNFQPFQRNDIRTSCLAPSGCIHEQSEPGIKRYSMDQVMSFDKFGRLQFDCAKQHLASADSHLLSGTPSSSILFSSTSRDFSSRSSDNMRGMVYGEQRRTGDGSRQHDASYRQALSGDNRILRDTIRHRPRSYPGLGNDDAPSALDFHINTFPSAAGFLHPHLLPSSSTSETFSPLPSLSDRTDIHRQLTYFPSPTFSLSRFPSSLSSPAIGSSEMSGDATMVFPPNWSAEDIIVDMTPISDECSTSAYEAVNAERVRECKHKERFTEKIVKLGGKFKHALMNRIRTLRIRSKRNDGEDFQHRECCLVADVPEPSAPEAPPGLTVSLSLLSQSDLLLILVSKADFQRLDGTIRG